jgi:hypothetical protein
MKTKFGAICLSLLLLALSFTISSAQEVTPEPTVDHAAHHPGQSEAMQPMMDMMDTMMGMEMPADMRDKMNQMRGMMDMMSMMQGGGMMGDMMQPMMNMMDTMMSMEMPADMRDKMNQMRGMMDMMSMMDMMHGGGEMGGMMMQGETTPEATPAPDAMGGMAMEMNTGYSVDDLAPLAFAYHDGGDVYFVHPEASEENVAGVLTAMMGTDVITVPSLGQIPAELLGKVYVFTNGLEGMGPLGFQPDVFDSVPGNENYTPLRAIQFVTWQEGVVARELTSIQDILAAEEAGDVGIEAPGVVVNMPILVWPDGQR